MDTLKSAVMQQSGSSEVQSPSPDKEQRSSRGKRKNDTKDRYGTLKDTGTAGDITAQRRRRKKWVVLTNPERKKNPQRAKEIRKTVWGPRKRKALRRKRRNQNPMLQAQLLIRFFNANSDCCLPNVSSAFSDAEENGNISLLLPLSPRTNVPTAGWKILAQKTVIQPNLTSLPSSIPPSLTPLSSVGLKYSSFTPQRFNSENMSMLDLLGNSSFAENLTSLHSPKHSLQASIPSSTVGSFLSHSLAIIDEPNHLQDQTSQSSVSQDVDLDIKIISQDSPCSNCKILCCLCESLKQNCL